MAEKTRGRRASKKRTHKVVRRKHTKRHARKANRKGSTRRRVQRGGWSLANMVAQLPFGQDVVNVVRGAATGVTNVGRGYRGINPEVSQWPSKKQLVRSTHGRTRKPLNVPRLYRNNKAMVARITA